ncbi:efflux RND transporter periplasmic adaptor subunit [Marinilabiliaceae bacterium JC017]|nr:efflux RND transporter periplasmic adaptor subunit [Marinilabiliaceae bacterium JC017]
MKNLFLVPIIILILSLVFYRCATKSQAGNPEDEIAKKSFVEKQAVKVKVDKVRLGAFSRELMSNGKLKAGEKALVPFLVQEQISAVEVKNGQRVHKGELLAQVEPFKYKKELEDSRDHYEKARIDLEDQLLGYGYVLKDSAGIPANILKMARIRSGYNQALSNLQEAERNFTHTSVLAPISGVVANLEAQANNPSSTYKRCCEVIDDAVMQVEFSVLEGEMNRVKSGQKVEVTPFALQAKSFPGIVTAINPTVDEHGMITVQAEVKNPSGELMDGMNAKILVKNEQQGCIIIPKTAVLYRQNRKVVFIHDDGIAKWVYVEIGQENSSEVTITDNSLKPGQEVIVSNNLNLAHETKVTIYSDQ